MLISKFDLYKTEWLELVFDNRNKAYGAYELRQHNSRTMLTAMGIAIAVVGLPVILIGALMKPVVTAVPPLFKIIPVKTFVIEHPQLAQPHHPHANVSPPPAQSSPANTPRLYVPVATPPPVTVQPTRVDPAPTGDLGPVTTGINDGTKGTGTPGTGTGTGTSDGTGTTEPFRTVEQMPEPIGGAAAWGKFLNKNLKYPTMAVDERIQGKVWVSFIVEKDGHLSNIVVERGLGYGTTEEAIRVLKMAPAWKPGIQNGQPVRVRYTLPINFQISDDNN
jgi:periplasmic protein TonB